MGNPLWYTSVNGFWLIYVECITICPQGSNMDWRKGSLHDAIPSTPLIEGECLWGLWHLIDFWFQKCWQYELIWRNLFAKPNTIHTSDSHGIVALFKLHWNWKKIQTSTPSDYMAWSGQGTQCLIFCSIEHVRQCEACALVELAEHGKINGEIMRDRIRVGDGFE